eukprot:scaffold72928_cov35-Attheya_sp.AAC.1
MVQVHQPLTPPARHCSPRCGGRATSKGGAVRMSLRAVARTSPPQGKNSSVVSNCRRPFSLASYGNATEWYVPVHVTRKKLIVGRAPNKTLE